MNKPKFEFTIHSDCFLEIESLERAFENLGATKLNREGWPTSYGGTGVTLWAEVNQPKKNIRQILSATNAKLLQVRSVNI